MGDMADWDVDQGIESDIEEPWLAEEQEAEERRRSKRKQTKAERRFKLTSTTVPELNGLEFTVDNDATEEEIAQAAADLAIESISYGWDEVDAGRREARKRKPSD